MQGCDGEVKLKMINSLIFFLILFHVHLALSSRFLLLLFLVFDFLFLQSSSRFLVAQGFDITGGGSGDDGIGLVAHGFLDDSS